MEDILSSINWAVIAPLLVIKGLLIIVALIDWFRTSTMNGPKWLWLIMILFLTMLGPVLYFIFGRREH